MPIKISYLLYHFQSGISILLPSFRFYVGVANEMIVFILSFAGLWETDFNFSAERDKKISCLKAILHDTQRRTHIEYKECHCNGLMTLNIVKGYNTYKTENTPSHLNSLYSLQYKNERIRSCVVEAKTSTAYFHFLFKLYLSTYLKLYARHHINI